MISVEFLCEQHAVTRSATDGQTVTYTADPGVVLKKLSGGIESVVSAPSPFVHHGPDCDYMLECVSYSGAPVYGTLSIEGA
jgi:hypothetical protein